MCGTQIPAVRPGGLILFFTQPLPSPDLMARACPVAYGPSSAHWPPTCTMARVCMIISLPYAVVEAEMARQGILPTVAPVKPYTLFADTCGTAVYGSSAPQLPHAHR